MVLSNGANLSIVAGVIAFFSSAIIMLIIVVRRRFLTHTIRVGFISKGGYIERKRYKMEGIGKTLKKGKGKYIYDAKAVVTTRFGKELYYPKDSTTPIKFDATGLQDDADNITPENLKAIVETELIAKLFKKEILNTENILLVASLVLNLIGIVLLFSIKSGGVMIKDSPANIELLKKVMTEVLKGV